MVNPPACIEMEICERALILLDINQLVNGC